MAVAVRGAFEYALDPTALDAAFGRIIGPRGDRQLLFSAMVGLMATVVCRVQPSVHAAYQDHDSLPVRVTALDARLARVPPTATRDLVRHTADRLAPLVRAMGGAETDPIPGCRVKVLDGNHPGKTQRRLEVLRDVVAGPLPGQTLVVLDPALGSAIDVVAGEDGHAQERSLLDPILDTVAANDVRVADRNFCTTDVLFGIARKAGSFVIRRHAASLCWEKETKWEPAGRAGTGTLAERTIGLLDAAGAKRAVRQIRLTLDQPTSGGDGVIEILTNLRPPVATAAVVAQVYRGRWTVEGLFLRLTTVLKCGVNTLGYPPAALFGFGVALAAGNVYAAVKAALRAAHGAEAVDRVSDYHMAWEVSGTRPGLEIAVPAEQWAEIRVWSVAQMATWLVDLAREAKSGRYRKAIRGPKKPRTPRTRFAKSGHSSTARLLKGEQT